MVRAVPVDTGQEDPQRRRAPQWRRGLTQLVLGAPDAAERRSREIRPTMHAIAPAAQRSSR